MTNAPIYPWTLPVTHGAHRLMSDVTASIPTLRTERLTLRPPALGDFDVYAQIMADDHSGHMGGSLSASEAWADFCVYCAGWMLRGAGMWAVCLQDTAIGFVTIGMEIGDQEHELGYFFLAPYHGQGFAVEAATAARDYARIQLRLPSLVSYVAKGNLGSVKIAQALGATRDDLSKLPDDNADEDIVIYRYALGDEK